MVTLSVPDLFTK